MQTRATSLPSGTVSFLSCPTKPGSGKILDDADEETEEDDEVRLFGEE